MSQTNTSPTIIVEPKASKSKKNTLISVFIIGLIGSIVVQKTIINDWK